MRTSLSTKRIANLAGVTTAAVNETARDLRIEMTYREDLHSWMVVAEQDARMLVSMLATEDSDY